ncbi:hypothetical protein HN011_011714 [Eciton burchellii]|nr:hypothetical protein HN011_011714 [Eciton burchellii]
MKVKAIIEEVIVQPNKIQPIIVAFQNGQSMNDDTKNMSCGLFHDETKDKTLLALSNGQTVYKGYKPDSEKDSRTMLVLHNKKTGKVRLVEAEQWQVNPVLEMAINEENNIENNDMENDIEKIDQTTLNKFKSRKSVRRAELSKFINDDDEKGELEETVLNVEINKSDLSTQLSTTESVINSFLPTCNRSASNVKDVYNIYDIIPKSKLETLYEHVVEILNGKIEGKSKFFECTMESIRSDPDNVNKIAILFYIEMINTWFSMSLKDAKKRNAVVCHVSEDVNQHIINTYSISSVNGRSRPNAMKDKGLIHSLILALTISNFTLNLQQFRIMLGIRTSLKRLTELAKIIGTTHSKENKKIITLKIPLPIPVFLTKRARKRVH